MLNATSIVLYCHFTVNGLLYHMCRIARKTLLTQVSATEQQTFRMSDSLLEDSVMLDVNKRLSGSGQNNANGHFSCFENPAADV